MWNLGSSRSVRIGSLFLGACAVAAGLAPHCNGATYAAARVVAVSDMTAVAVDPRREQLCAFSLENGALRRAVDTAPAFRPALDVHYDASQREFWGHAYDETRGRPLLWSMNEKDLDLQVTPLEAGSIHGVFQEADGGRYVVLSAGALASPARIARWAGARSLEFLRDAPPLDEGQNLMFVGREAPSSGIGEFVIKDGKPVALNVRALPSKSKRWAVTNVTASTWIVGDEDLTGIWLSSDDGTTWVLQGQIPSRDGSRGGLVRLDVNRNRAGEVFATVRRRSKENERSEELWLSGDLGRTWKAVLREGSGTWGPLFSKSAIWIQADTIGERVLTLKPIDSRRTRETIRLEIPQRTSSSQ